MGLLDPPTYSRTQADARYQPRTDPAYTVALGDSIDADSTGYFPTACALTGQRMRYAGNFSVGGDTTADVLARVDDVINVHPIVCIVGGGVTNDIGQGVAAATTRANIAAIVEALQAVGIAVVLHNCPPRGAGDAPYNTDALAIAAVTAHNTWISGYATAEGLDLFDMYTALADPETGLHEAAFSGDGIHPNPAGSLAAGKAFRDADLRTFRHAPPFDLITSTYDGTGNLFLGAGLTDGSWTTEDNSLAAPVGQWQRYATAGSSWVVEQPRLHIPSGTFYEIGFRVAVTVAPVYFSVRAYQADDTTAVGSWADLQITAPFTVTDGAVHLIRGVIPAGAAMLRFYIQNQASASPSPGPADFRIAQLTWRRRP